MKRKAASFPSVLNTFVTFVLLLALITTSTADSYSLGSASLSPTVSKAVGLKTTTTVRSSVRSMRFVGKVGGVAFDAVAAPETGFKVKSLTMGYNPKAEDGTRLILTINGRPVTAELPDWLLFPIANYAASNSTSCFTLFGELEDKTEQEKLQRQGGRILNYDDAFRDTLLGMRLFQMDVLILSDEFMQELPKDKEGAYVLGKGETAPVPEEAGKKVKEYRGAHDQLRVKALDEDFDTDFESYVICDLDNAPQFVVESGALKLTGEPFYYFWREDKAKQLAAFDKARAAAAKRQGAKFDPKQVEEEKNAARKKLQALYSQIEWEESKHAGLVAETETEKQFEERKNEASDLVETARETASLAAARKLKLAGEDEDYTDFRHRVLEDSLSDDLAKSEKAQKDWKRVQETASQELTGDAKAAQDLLDQIARLRQKVRDRMESDGKPIRAEIERLNAINEQGAELMRNGQFDDERGVVYLEKYSKEHSQIAGLLAEANPAVWNATRDTMRYAAFFRYVKKNFPAAWKKFGADLKKANLSSIQPKVTTPSVMTMPRAPFN